MRRSKDTSTSNMNIPTFGCGGLGNAGISRQDTLKPLSVGRFRRLEPVFAVEPLDTTFVVHDLLRTRVERMARTGAPMMTGGYSRVLQWFVSVVER